MGKSMKNLFAHVTLVLSGVGTALVDVRRLVADRHALVQEERRCVAVRTETETLMQEHWRGALALQDDQRRAAVIGAETTALCLEYWRIQLDKVKAEAEVERADRERAERERVLKEVGGLSAAAAQAVGPTRAWGAAGGGGVQSPGPRDRPSPFLNGGERPPMVVELTNEDEKPSDDDEEG